MTYDPNTGKPGQVSIYTWVLLGLALLNAIIPMQIVNETLFHVKEETVYSDTYDQKRLDFDEVPTLPSFSLMSFRNMTVLTQPQRKMPSRNSKNSRN
jgi:hypothetical protein